MPFDLATTGRSARENIAVPDVPLGGIRERSLASARAARRRTAVALAAVLVFAGAGAAYGAKIYQGVRLILGGGKVAVNIASLVMVREPTAADIRDIAERATFPVVLPVGLPSDARATMVLYAPREHPDSVTIDYSSAHGFGAGFSLFDTSHVETNSTALPSQLEQSEKDVYVWRVGQETVVVPKSHMTGQDQQRIQTAMAASSRTDSLERTTPLLQMISIQGASSEIVQIASRYAPANGRAVLLDERYSSLIPADAAKGQAFLDTRVVYLDDIPSDNGEPDYSQAKISFPKRTVIPPSGVRAIAAVLRRGEVRTNCPCAILFDGSDDSSFRIWTIPSGSHRGSVHEYSVDATTLRVTPRS